MIGFNLNKAKRHFTSLLTERFPQREAEQLMRILLEDLFDIDQKRQLLEPDLRLDEFQHARLADAVKRLLEGVPVQYVTGKAWFDGLLFHVDESVLIPRPETEELVQKVSALMPNDRPFRIWDVGTGSGCIAIAMAKRFPQAEVKAFDVSEKALAVASKNAINNKVKVDFICDDVLHPQSSILYQPVDVVISNPPYIRESERSSMERNVLDHEPSQALFVPDDDPLLFYRQILKLAKSRLTAQGSIWFEINEALGEEMVQLCREMDFEGEILLDFFEKPRFLRIFAID
ncbi:MAG: peptide chain release factor N(5)-glutamine methyltransferase [Bacteroidales bacterium]|nr:peptide chain release factor N(5)-glutamine methyltransferase [Bacteroidales bacterium]